MAYPSKKKSKETRWRHPADIESYFTKIKWFLEIWCSIRESCLHAWVPYTTVNDYINNSVEFSDRIDVCKNYAIELARRNRISEVKKWNYQASKDYLERKKKDEFSLRQETTGKDWWPVEMNVKNVLDELIK